MKMIINWMKRLNQSLAGLVAGILIYGALVELIGVWFAKDKMSYTIGLIIGIACAVGMAIHLAMIIEESVRRGQGQTKLLAVKSVMRYLVVCVVVFAVAYFKIGSFYTAIAGILGLKVSAYAQPLLNKVLFKSSKGEEINKTE